MNVQGRRKRGRPKNIRWLDRVRVDIKENGVSGEKVYDRATWRGISSNIDPHKNWNKMKEKKNYKNNS